MIEESRLRGRGEGLPARRKSSRINPLPYYFIAPGALIIAIVSVYPALFSLYASFTNWKIAGGSPEFVGLQNYVRALSEPDLLHSLFITGIFTIVTVVIPLALGIAIAMLLSKDFFGAKLVRSVILLPLMMTPVVVGYVYLIILNADYGVFNYLLELSGVPALWGGRPVVWLGAPWPAFLAISFAEVWTATPLAVLITLAGIQSLPSEPFEAAIVDGATRGQTFWHVTLPMLRTTLLVVLALRILQAPRTFDLVFSLTNGGPGGFTEVLMLKAYLVAVQFSELGYGSSLAILLTVLTLAVLALTFLIVKYLDRRSARI